MQARISMITLGVRALDPAVRFYEQGLGFPRLPAEGEVAFFSLAGSWLALYPCDLLAGDAGLAAAGTGFRGVSLAHNVSSREAVDAVLAEAARAGAQIVRPAGDTHWGGYVGYFADPDAHLWEVAWNPFFWPGPPAE